MSSNWTNPIIVVWRRFYFTLVEPLLSSKCVCYPLTNLGLGLSYNGAISVLVSHLLPLSQGPVYHLLWCTINCCLSSQSNWGILHNFLFFFSCISSNISFTISFLNRHESKLYFSNLVIRYIYNFKNFHWIGWYSSIIVLIIVHFLPKLLKLGYLHIETGPRTRSPCE